MRIAILAPLTALLVGCAGMSSQQAKQIEDRLGRIESRLDDLAARTAAAPVAIPLESLLSALPIADGESVRQSELLRELVEVYASVQSLKLQGFTRNWPALKSGQDRLAELVTQLAAASEVRSVPK